MGTWGGFFCNVLDRITQLLPSSPFTFGSLAQQLGSNIPFVGSYLIYDWMITVVQILSLVAFYKLYRDLPARF